jgi:2-dehydropantoate 2-reductase
VSGQISTIAVIGAGAMGGMYAAHFARAGFDTRFVAAGERAKRLQAQGLVVNGERIDAGVVDADAPGGWVADLVIVAVKAHHLDAAIDQLAAVVTERSIVLSVLNGLDSEERIAQRLGNGPTVLLSIALAMDAERRDGEVRYRQAGKLVIGSREEDSSPALAVVEEALGRAGLACEAETPQRMRHRMWWKFMINVGINQPSAVLNAPYGAFQHEGEARSLMEALIQEVLAVASAGGVALGADDVAAWHEVLAGQPPEGRTSMHQDVLAGRPTEVDVFGGRVVALGRRHGIPTPFNQAMVWVLKGRIAG